ncbi:MAG: thioredoxin [Lachnospiraceae bacterium]|nr:thioredoxin [Lachnospiraceae bacterium]
MAVVHLSKENFSEQVLESKGLVLVDFWATWCAPCMMLAPFIEELAAEESDIVVGKVDIDESQELAIQYRVASIPTLILFKDGQEVKRTSGFMPKDAVKAWIGG